jgi:RNA polymerase sigma-70 factor (ECF subfamily)
MEDAPDPAVDLAAVFEAERPRLLAIAYRMLGSRSDAEDIVQDSFLRVREVELAKLGSPRGYLTTVVVHLCLDVLKSARVHRARYDGPWLPEPVYTDEATIDRDSVAMAFLVVLETLSPEERAVYVLHELFDYTHSELAELLHKTEPACRQMLRRAHQRVAARQPRYAISDDDRVRLVGQLIAACRAGDATAVRALLTEDAIAWADGGGKAAAARRPVEGAERVARYLVGLAKKGAAGNTAEIAELNGAPAMLIRRAGVVVTAMILELAPDGRIGRIQFVRNPDKLTHLQAGAHGG